jgi:hypothetical protein
MQTTTAARDRLLVGAPVATRRLYLAGVSTAVLEGGSGPPLVLLPGPGSHAGAWLPVLPTLTATHHVIAPDLPGQGESAADPLLDVEGLLDWLAALIDETCTELPVLLSVWCILSTAPPAPFVPPSWHGRRLCAMAICYSGPPDRAAEALAPLRVVGEPVFDLVGPMENTAVQSYLDDTEPEGMHYSWRTEFLSRLDDGLLTALGEAFPTCPMQLGEIGLLHIGGALNERAEDDGAVGNRDGRYVVVVKGMWAPDDAGAADFRTWVRGVGDRVHQFGTGRTYINFQTDDENDARTRATYARNFERLLAIK